MPKKRSNAILTAVQIIISSNCALWLDEKIHQFGAIVITTPIKKLIGRILSPIKIQPNFIAWTLRSSSVRRHPLLGFLFFFCFNSFKWIIILTNFEWFSTFLHYRWPFLPSHFILPPSSYFVSIISQWALLQGVLEGR